MDFSVVILAAGQGTRMRSALPKVLQPLAGRPLLAHVIDTARQLSASEICIVYGHGGEAVRERFSDDTLSWALQAEQLGTGHAVQQALPEIRDDTIVLILCGDVPLITAGTLQALLDASQGERLALLTVDMQEPAGYGRIVRDSAGNVSAIVEERDATDEQRQIREINAGLMACPGTLLGDWLQRITPDNAQGEYYLTDIVGCAVADNQPVAAVRANSPDEIIGINDRRQLATAEQVMRRRNADRLLDQGVTLTDPERVDVRGKLECGRDVHIDVNVIFDGDVTLGDNVEVGPHTVIRDSVIGAGSRIQANCVIEDAVIGVDCEIGPFARVRPGTRMDERAKLGNFVEIKNSTIGPGSKVNHLTYIGDTAIGREANVGAGTVTCNYDGANKHKTVIGDRAFIGSGTMLVAPVEIGAGATVGAGSTITRPVAAETLAVERSKQATISGWKRPEKKNVK